MTHQCHDVIGQVPRQVRGHKTREASEGNTCVILVGTAEILGKKKKKRQWLKEETARQKKVDWGINNCQEIFIEHTEEHHWPFGSDWWSAWWHQCSRESTARPPGSQSSGGRKTKQKEWRTVLHFNCNYTLYISVQCYYYKQLPTCSSSMQMYLYSTKCDYSLCLFWVSFYVDK